MALTLSISDLKLISDGMMYRFSVTIKDQDGPLWTSQGWRVKPDGNIMAPSALGQKGFRNYNQTHERFERMLLKALKTYKELEEFLIELPEVITDERTVL